MGIKFYPLDFAGTDICLIVSGIVAGGYLLYPHLTRPVAILMCVHLDDNLLPSWDSTRSSFMTRLIICKFYDFAHTVQVVVRTVHSATYSINVLS